MTGSLIFFKNVKKLKKIGMNLIKIHSYVKKCQIYIFFLHYFYIFFQKIKFIALYILSMIFSQLFTSV